MSSFLLRMVLSVLEVGRLVAQSHLTLNNISAELIWGDSQPRLVKGPIYLSCRLNIMQRENRPVRGPSPPLASLPGDWLVSQTLILALGGGGERRAALLLHVLS